MIAAILLFGLGLLPPPAQPTRNSLRGQAKDKKKRKSCAFIVLESMIGAIVVL